LPRDRSGELQSFNEKVFAMATASRFSYVVLIGLLATQPGCILLNSFLPRKDRSSLDTSLLKAQGYSIPPGGMPAHVALDPNDGPRVILEVRSDERHLETIPLTDKGMFIEDLVQQAKLHETFGVLNISIMRPNGEGAPPVRLDLTTNDEGKATNVGQNYALRPGDHIIVLNDDRTYVERFVAKTFRTN